MKLPTNMEEVRAMIRQAKLHLACKEDLNSLEACETIEQINELKARPYYLSWYANYVLKRRWPEAEEIIMTNADASFLYANYVLKRQWPGTEEIINTIPRYKKIHDKLPK